MGPEEIMENEIAKNPEKYIGEKDLTLISRQYTIGNYRFDLLFEDRHGSKLIVELQYGTLDRTHTYKILDYVYEYKRSHPGEFIEVMIIANKIPRERRDRLNDWGIPFKEIPESEFPISDNRSTKLDSFNVTSLSQKTYPKNISTKWDKEALDKVNDWLIKYINRFPIGEKISIGEVAKSSRSIAHIKPKGNIEGVRYLFRKLHKKELVDLPDNLNFILKERVNE